MKKSLDNLKMYKCQNCGKGLFFAELTECIISKDCPKCGERNIIIAEKIVTSNQKRELVKK